MNRRLGVVQSRDADPGSSSLYYEGCPKIIRPFWISLEPVAWPWCNLLASQRRPYCISVKSNSPVGLVGRQWEAVDWACALCDRRIHNDRGSRSANLHQCACPFYRSRAGFFFFLQNITSPGSVSPLQPIFGSLRFLAFPKAKIAVDLWMRRSHSTQAQSTVSHCRPTSPTGEWLFMDAQ